MSDFLKSSSRIDGSQSVLLLLVLHVCPAVLELGSSPGFHGVVRPLFPQASLSLPGSPFDKRRGSQYSVTWARNDRRYGDRVPLVLQNLDQESDVPFADESVVGTPLSEESGAVLATCPSGPHSRHSSYTSHSSRISYTSHGDVCGPRGGPPIMSWSKSRPSGCFHEVRSLCPDLLFLRSLLFHLNHGSHSCPSCCTVYPPLDQSDRALMFSSSRISSSTLRSICSP